MDRDDPSAVADKALLPFLLGSSRLAHPVIGWKKSVQSLTRDDVTAFHRRWVTPDNSLLAVVGDVDPKTLVPELERRFADWRPSASTRTAAGWRPGRATGPSASGTPGPGGRCANHWCTRSR